MIESTLYRRRFSTARTREIFSGQTLVRHSAAVEAAVARAQAELGLIPTEAAQAIAAMADGNDPFDLAAIAEAMEQSTHTFIDILRHLQDRCGAAGQYMHLGLTTQDVQDTALVLQIRDVLAEVDRELAGVIARLAEQVDRTLSLPALARTQGQPALPTTFGLRMATWLDELLRHVERIEQMKKRLLVAELFGAVGTMAGFGTHALSIAEAAATHLGLALPHTAWHAARDRIAEYLNTMIMVATTCGRIANELRRYAGPELGEISFGWANGHIGSSTMPQKRNPEGANQVVVLARLAAAQLASGVAAMTAEDERDTRAHRLEWASVPEVSHYTVAALTLTGELLAGLHFHEDVIKSHLAAAPDVASERLMLALADTLGRRRAHEHVHGIAQRCRKNGLDFRAEVDADPLVREALAPADIALVFDSETYLGEATRLASRVIEAARTAARQRAENDEHT